MKITKPCEVCETLFTRFPSAFGRRKGNFVCRKCYLEKTSEEWKKNNPSVPMYGEDNPMYGKHGWNYNPNGSARKDGYIRVAVEKERMLKHRLIVEQHLGRKLLPSEVVHHKDHDNTNNDISNLEVTTQSEHARHHMIERYKARKLFQSGGDNHSV